MLLTRTLTTSFCYGLTCFFALNTITYAANSDVSQPQSWRPILSVTGGVAITENTGRSQTLPIIDSSLYAYQANNSDQSKVLFGGLVGVEMMIDPAWAFQLGLSYYQPATFTAKGQLTQGADPQSSDVFDYQYDMISRQLLLETKILFTWCRYHPYFSMGLGVGFNSAENYEVDFPPFLTFTPIFSNHSTETFTYNVGVGLDVDLDANWRIGLGYRFTDLGKVGLGNGMIDTVPTHSTLSQGRWYANEVVAQLTFLMN